MGEHSGKGTWLSYFLAALALAGVGVGCLSLLYTRTQTNLVQRQTRVAELQTRLAEQEIQFTANRLAVGYNTIVVPTTGYTAIQNIAVGGTLSPYTESELKNGASVLLVSVCALQQYRCWPSKAFASVGGWIANVSVGQKRNGSLQAFYLIRLDLVGSETSRQLFAQVANALPLDEQNAGAVLVGKELSKPALAETMIVRT